jgi:autotransporter-associated beta strand protein
LGANSQTLTGLTGGGTVSTTSGGALTLNIASGNNTFSGALTGAGGLTKSGSGKLTLSGTNTLSGTTTVSAGELAVNGSLSGGVTVNSSTTLSGTGTIGGATTISGTHTPGASPGLQTFTNGLTYNATSVLVWELSSNTASSRGTLFDGIDVTGGDLTIASGASLELDFTAALSNGTPSNVTWFDSFWDSNRSWTIIDKSGAGSSTGNFTITDISTALGGWAYNVVRPNSSFTVNNTGGDIVLNWNTATAIPEPSSALLALLAGGSLLLRRRRN